MPESLDACSVLRVLSTWKMSSHIPLQDLCRSFISAGEECCNKPLCIICKCLEFAKKSPLGKSLVLLSPTLLYCTHVSFEVYFIRGLILSHAHRFVQVLSVVTFEDSSHRFWKGGVPLNRQTRPRFLHWVHCSWEEQLKKLVRWQRGSWLGFLVCFPKVSNCLSLVTDLLILISNSLVEAM